MGTTVGVVGTGNMGGALVRGWLRACEPEVTFLIYDVIPDRVEALATDERVAAAATLDEVAGADVILLVVKPKDLPDVLGRLSPRLAKDTLIISSAAGVTLESVRAAAGPEPAVFRIMPNIGVELGEGVVAVAAETGTTADMLARVTDLLTPLGLVEVVGEELFDAVTAASGSSIAFLALALEGMEDGAVQAGMPRASARAFVRQTALAGAMLLRQHPGSAADIKDQVSSPAGTTIAGLAALEDAGVRGAFMRAIEQATARGRAMRDAARPRVLE